MSRETKQSFATINHVAAAIPIAVVATLVVAMAIRRFSAAHGLNGRALTIALSVTFVGTAAWIYGWFRFLGAPHCRVVSRTDYEKFRLELQRLGFEVGLNSDDLVVYGLVRRGVLGRIWNPFLQVRVRNCGDRREITVSRYFRFVFRTRARKSVGA